MGKITKTRLARVPEEVWVNHQHIAERFQLPSTVDAFRLTNKFLHGDVVVKKSKKEKNKNIWEIELKDY